MLQRFHSDVKNDRLRAVKATLLSTPQVLSSINSAVRGPAAVLGLPKAFDRLTFALPLHAKGRTVLSAGHPST